MSEIKTALPPVVAEHIAAVNGFDTDGIVATFAKDAYVNDVGKEFVGVDAIREFVTEQLVRDHVTIDVRDVRDHYGDVIVHAQYDGAFDKTGLPDEVIMTSYFSVRQGRIVSLALTIDRSSPR